MGVWLARVENAQAVWILKTDLFVCFWPIFRSCHFPMLTEA
ncbi:hypothetical protein F383_27955 [Gossypium arboreum]|uniref:Uncharacterized protein n=1 Tax=Gossypium arboreum TaxID=29729 RepID=A0A0B0MRZ7_GOSAR|nr:hypothetical protein F383_27955 [Gossypium arboreum]